MVSNDFVGRGWAFPLRFLSPQSGPNMADSKTLIKQSMYLLLNTFLGERQFHTGFGSRLSEFTFSNIDGFVLADVKEEIANTVLLNEPRINLIDIEFDSSKIYDGIVNISLKFLVKEDSSLNNMVFPYYLNTDVL